jgi:hypothetical protein
MPGAIAWSAQVAYPYDVPKVVKGSHGPIRQSVCKNLHIQHSIIVILQNSRRKLPLSIGQCLTNVSEHLKFNFNKLAV